MRYWLKRSRSYDSDWEYAVEYYGFNHAFTKLEFLHDFREHLTNSRSAFGWRMISSPFRSLKNGTFNSAHYHFASWPSAIYYFWTRFYIHFRYHLKLRPFSMKPTKHSGRDNPEITHEPPRKPQNRQSCRSRSVIPRLHYQLMPASLAAFARLSSQVRVPVPRRFDTPVYRRRRSMAE
jgi:hypothetical protein